MSHIRGRVREYIEKMNRISVIILIAGMIISCTILICSVILVFASKSAYSPMRTLILADEMCNIGAVIFLTSPIIALILDMFIKAYKKGKE